MLLSCAVVELASSQAEACGATPPMHNALVPLPDAENVPLDAVLIASGNFTGSSLEFHLREAVASLSGTEGEVGFLVELPVDVACHTVPGGALCIARPRGLLAPHTRYEWLSTPDSAPWQSFTTSDRVHSERSPRALEVAVKVTSHMRFRHHPCGATSSATLHFDAVELDSPYVVNISGFTPSYVMLAQSLTPSEPALDFMLSSPPACVTPELFDVTGARIALPELCLQDLLPAVWDDGEPVGADSDEVEAPSSDEVEAAPADDGLSPESNTVDHVPGTAEPPETTAADHGVETSAVDLGTPSDGGGCAMSPDRRRSPSGFGAVAFLALMMGAVRRRRGLRSRSI